MPGTLSTPSLVAARKINDKVHVLSVSLTPSINSGMTVLTADRLLRSSPPGDINDGVSERLWCFLREIVADQRNVAALIASREVSGVVRGAT